MANGAIRTSEILQDDNLDALIAKMKALEGSIESITGALKKEEAAAAELEATTKTLNGTTAAGREQIAKSAKATDEIERAHKAYNKALSDEQVKLQELRLATATITNLKKNEAKAALSAEGSYNKLSAQYSIMKLALNAMSKAQREGTEEGRKLVKTANDTYQEMKRLQAETGKTALNVGNYSEAVQIANQNLGEMRKELLALKNVSFAGKTEEEIATINQRIGTLVDSMDDLRAQQKALGTEMSTLFVGSLKVVSAGVEGLVGTLSILGVESESLQNLERKMVQLIAVTHALSEIEDALQKKTIQTTFARIQSAIITAKDTVLKWANTVSTAAAARAEDARAIATARGSIATRAAAAVQWIWNAALAANPIGLVVVGVAALAAGIIYLTTVMSDNTDEIERQSEAYAKLVKEREREEGMIQHRIDLAREQGESDIELTKRELNAAKDRRVALFNEHQAFLKIFNSKKRVTDEEISKNKEYYDERLETVRNIQLLEARLGRQEMEGAERRRNQAEENAKRARSERERIERENTARLKERQDAAIAELETEKAFQLAFFDAQTDYGNQSAEYQRQRAGERLELEQELGKALLNVQRQYNRISQTEFETALLNMQAAMAEFSAKITEERNAETPGLLPGIDLSKKNEEKAKKRVEEIMSKLAKNAREALEKKKTPEDIFDLLGIDVTDKEKETIKSSFDFARQQMTDFLAFRTQIANRNVQNADREVQAAQAALDNQITLQAAGLANTVQSRQKDLADAQANREKALKQQEIAARQEQLISGAQQAVNMALALSKLFATNPILAIGLGALVIGSFVGFKIAAANASKRQYGEGDYQILQGGSHASGNDIPLGTSSRDGRPEYAEGGEARMILPKGATAKYRMLLPEIFQALKQKTFEREFERIGSATSGIPIIINAAGSTVNTQRMEGSLNRLVMQGQEKTVLDGKGRLITTYRNLTSIREN